MSKTNKKSRIAIAVAAGVVGAGALTVSAASLGDLNAQSLGSSETKVISCQAPDKKIDINWGIGMDNSTAKVTEFSVSNLSKTCNGGEAQLTLKAGNGAALDTVKGTVDGGQFTGKVDVDPSKVTGTVLTITGTPANSNA